MSEITSSACLTVSSFHISLFLSYPLPSLPSPSFWLPVPGAPPRKLEVEAVNSTAIRVTWRPPLQGKQHGQIRGYQVIFSRLENGEPRGQPNIMDVALPEAQVLSDALPVSSLSLSLLHCLMFIYHYIHSSKPPFPFIFWIHTSFSLTATNPPPIPFSIFTYDICLNWYPAPTALD